MSRESSHWWTVFEVVKEPNLVLLSRVGGCGGARRRQCDGVYIGIVRPPAVSGILGDPESPMQPRPACRHLGGVTKGFVPLSLCTGEFHDTADCGLGIEPW